MNEQTHTKTNSPTGNNASSTMDRIAKGAHKGIDSAADAAHPGIDRASAGAHKVVDNADDMVGQAAESLDRAGIKSQEIITASKNYMHEHPLLTLGAAVAAGYFLSRLTTPR